MIVMRKAVVAMATSAAPWKESARRLLWTWTVGLAVVAIVLLLGPLGPLIETRFSPVVSDGAWGGTFIKVPGGIVVKGSHATKKRDCGWERTQFFLGERGETYTNIGINSGLDEIARHLGPPKVRGKGRLVWEEIFLPVTPEQFESGLVFADAFHKCSDDIAHLTRSRLFN